MMGSTNIDIGGVKLEIKFTGKESDRYAGAIGKIFPDYLSAEGNMNIPLVVRERPDVPLDKLFGGGEAGALRDYFLKIEGRFPFTEVSPGWRRRRTKTLLRSSRGNGAALGSPSLIPLLSRDRMAVFYHNSFLLFADYEKPKGEVLILEGDFSDTVSSVSLAVQAAVGLFAPLYNGMMLHACSAEIDGGGYIFFGGSGAGKSTIADLMGRKRLLADDGSLCFRRGKDYCTMPSPFTQVPSRENRGELIQAKRFFFLIKDKDNFVEEVKPGEAILRIMHNHIHFFRYFPGKEAKETFISVKEIVERFPFYNLHFTRYINPLTFFGEGGYKRGDRRKEFMSMSDDH
ncbi:MAG: hypothetical protein JW984_08245 [Deltaproteobacteria bacterium]|uniref:Uncharacterized protein n=1 Tax=Candidatus Zymogenus saltonus TaxID=2844893 RepID=A0A9D8PPS6_9DELT|nr:hypothetical protein [Candidatus Zymogenus saltonus]